MSKLEKLIKKIVNGESVTYSEAEKILFRLGFSLEIKGSHHIFRKKAYSRNISLKKRSELLLYQLEMLQEVLKDHGY
ncbi:MAG: hypothetical protein ACSNEK_10080 [Parachlamydiaceae bacterium]